MHFRRLATLLLGFWLGCSVFMSLVATHNFSAVDDLLAKPAAGAANDIGTLGRAEARVFLRHFASELNRSYFQVWHAAQLVVGVILLLVLFFGANSRTSLLTLTMAMIVAVGLQHWLLTPEIVRLGRLIDFAPAGSATANLGRFWGFHGTYSTIEVVKLLLGIVLTVKLLSRRRRLRSGDIEELDTIDDADNGHVDRR